MKKLLFSFLVGSSFQLGAQTFTKINVPLVEGNRFDVKVKTNNIKASILSDFMKRFGEVTDVEWFVDDRNATAYFTENDEATTVYYHERSGSHLSTRKTYRANKLDNQIVEFLEMEIGPCFQPDQVAEISREDNKVYEISLLSGKQLCIARVQVSLKDKNLNMIEKIFLKRGDL